MRGVLSEVRGVNTPSRGVCITYCYFSNADIIIFSVNYQTIVTVENAVYWKTGPNCC